MRTTISRGGARLWMDEDGAALVEYGMLVLLVALTAIVAVTTLGTKIKAIFTSADTSLPTT